MSTDANNNAKTMTPNATAQKATASAAGNTNANTSKDNRGLECRHCGCRHFRVIYTRRGWGEKLIRRRECRNCGRRMTTWERPIGA